MNIYRFINSRDVAIYLKKINYKFSPLEMAWIIWHCEDATVKEKHDAWRELIEATKDCEIPKRMNCSHYDSLHDFIKKYMSIEDKVIENFRKDNGLFIYETNYFEEKPWIDESSPFSKFDICLENGLKDLEYYDCPKDYTVRIKKICKDSDSDGTYEYKVYATFNYDGELLNITFNRKVDIFDEDLVLAFEGMWFSIPTPFKLGDIVIDVNDKRSMGPFVLEETVSNYKTDFMIKDGDISDMDAWGYFLHEDGDIYRDQMDNYLDLEYYKSPLVGNLRILKCVSSYLKKAINIDEALRYYHAILLDENSKKYNERLFYLEEYKKLGGVIMDEKELYIYLDDEREAPPYFTRTHSVNETIKLIEEAEKNDKKIMLLDLDHDLGDYAKDGGDAIKLLDWLVERNTLYPINIHTMNCVGRDNMERMIERYWK